MKRVDNALQKIDISPQTSCLQQELNKKEDTALQKAIEMQAKELVAQIGRVNSFSMKDGQDVRGNGDLHQKYTNKANKMDESKFNQNALDALEYENEKDSRGLLGNFSHALWKKPASMIASIFKDDNKPILDSGDWTTLACVGLVFLLPPANIAFGLICLGKAFKNDVYDGSKLQEWVNNNWFTQKDDPIKFKPELLNDVNVQGLFEETGTKVIEQKKEEVQKLNNKNTTIDENKNKITDREIPKEEIKQIKNLVEDLNIEKTEGIPRKTSYTNKNPVHEKQKFI
jgi:membrane-associated HD superfamily phosphohydrolase